MTFVISEDEALRDMLTGITVSDAENPHRPVKVWFGQPDQEIRAQSFPFITVDLIDISEATERVMNGRMHPWYYAPTDLPSGRGWDMYYPTPINLDYQVTTFARHPRHDRDLLAQVLGTRLPLRFGSLAVKESQRPNGDFDATIRRLDMLGVTKRDTTESGKRMFMNVFTVRVSSEIPTPYDFATYYKVMQVRLTTNGTSDPSAFDRSIFDAVIEVTVPTSGTP